MKIIEIKMKKNTQNAKTTINVCLIFNVKKVKQHINEHI